MLASRPLLPRRQSGTRTGERRWSCCKSGSPAGFLGGEAAGQSAEDRGGHLKFHKSDPSGGGDPAKATGAPSARRTLRCCTPTPSASTPRTEKRREGDEVKRLQNALVRLNYWTQGDGYFAKYTEEAVKYFRAIDLR